MAAGVSRLRRVQLPSISSKMGNFLVIVAADAWKQQADQLFQRGLENARTLKHQLPSQTAVSSWSRAASFPRQNGSGTPLSQDAQTGCWLLVIGTWFHADGVAPGNQAKLLERYLQVCAVQLAKELEGFFCVVIGDSRSKEVI